RAGLGTRIVEELLARTGGALSVWAHGQHPGAVALAARLGFTPVRELWQMRRSLLAPLPEPELPAGVRLRAFVPGQDDDEFLRDSAQSRVLLYVEADNAAAVKLYGSLGFTRWQADVSYRR